MWQAINEEHKNANSPVSCCYVNCVICKCKSKSINVQYNTNMFGVLFDQPLMSPIMCYISFKSAIICQNSSLQRRRYKKGSGG